MTDVPLSADDFPAFFTAVHEVPPFPWQVRLLNHLAEHRCWPAVLDLPTGSGKTAALDIAVFHLALEAGCAADRRAPIRIAFVVDRRLIVDDTFARAQRIADGLTWSLLDDRTAAVVKAELAGEKDRLATLQRVRAEPIVGCVARRLCSLSGGDRPLLVRRLRGGAPREDDWARTPAQPTILCSTVDQVGSRLLFRGYGVSDRMKPIHAGLLGSDCLILLDEAHLAEPFRQTLASIKTLRGRDAAPWQVALLSATPGAAPEAPDEKRGVFVLDDRDRADPTLAKRLNVSKPATLIDIAGRQGISAEMRRVEAVTEQTKAVLETLRRQLPSPAIGVVLNRVARARQVFDRLSRELADDASTILVIGPARAIERTEQAERDLRPIRTRTDAPRDLEKPLIVVATQTIEAGVDIDFDGLVTEAAALDALRQRFGRLNRAGRDIQPIAAILAHKDDIGTRADDAVYGDRIKKTWEALNKAWEARYGIAKQSAERIVNFGIAGFPPELADRADELAAEKAHAPVLMPAYADLWAQTSPIPNADPEVSLFLHGRDRSPASVQIVWRADIAENDLEERNRDRLAELLDLVPPRSGEAIEVPLWAARAWLRQQSEPLAGLSDTAERTPEAAADGRRGRLGFRYAGSDDRQRTRVVAASELRPGDLVVVPATYGGCDNWGWAPASVEPVVDVAEKAAKPYASRRFAVRVTPALICQAAADAEAVPLIEAVRAGLSALLAEHAEDKPPDLLDAVLGMGSLPETLRQWLDLIKYHCKGRPQREFPYGDDDGEAPGGVVFIAPRGLSGIPAAEDWAAVPATESDDLGAASERAQLLDEHSRNVQAYARRFAVNAGLPAAIADDLALAGYLHDAGKIDPRFQAFLGRGDPLGYDDRNVLAKSGRRSLRGAWERAGLPDNWRHEALSVRLARLHPDFAQAHDPALVLWLVGVHHGFGRPLFPHADQEDCKPRHDLPAALGVAWQLDTGYGPQSLAFDFKGRDWAQIFADLKERYGIWGLARLEAILRLADHRASEEATEIGKRIESLAPVRPADRTDETSLCPYRLEGLEPDNLLAFLALLGLLRTLEVARPQWYPRAAWHVDDPPLRPVLIIQGSESRRSIVEAAAEGAAALSAYYQFAAEPPTPGFQKDLNYSRCGARQRLMEVLAARNHDQAAVWAALMSDAAGKDERIEATPLCLLFGQGHQHFLERLSEVPRLAAPPPRGRGKQQVTLSAADTFSEALFQHWMRQDPTPAFRWDPTEDVRYALRADDPSSDKSTTQHGANRLAVFGLAALTVVPVQRGDRVRLEVVGGANRSRAFALAWPIWRESASLAAIRAMLSHPLLHAGPEPLASLGIAQVRMSRRISVGKFMNFTRA